MLVTIGFHFITDIAELFFFLLLRKSLDNQKFLESSFEWIYRLEWRRIGCLKWSIDVNLSCEMSWRWEVKVFYKLLCDQNRVIYESQIILLLLFIRNAIKRIAFKCFFIFISNISRLWHKRLLCQKNLTVVESLSSIW